MHSPAVGRLIAEHVLDKRYSSENQILGLNRFSGEGFLKETCSI
jgi:hypothetical protein